MARLFSARLPQSDFLGVNITALFLLFGCSLGVQTPQSPPTCVYLCSVRQDAASKLVFVLAVAMVSEGGEHQGSLDFRRLYQTGSPQPVLTAGYCSVVRTRGPQTSIKHCTLLFLPAHSAQPLVSGSKGADCSPVFCPLNSQGDQCPKSLNTVPVVGLSADWGSSRLDRPLCRPCWWLVS